MLFRTEQTGPTAVRPVQIHRSHSPHSPALLARADRLSCFSSVPGPDISRRFENLHPFLGSYLAGGLLILVAVDGHRDPRGRADPPATRSREKLSPGQAAPPQALRAIHSDRLQASRSAPQ